MTRLDENTSRSEDLKKILEDTLDFEYEMGLAVVDLRSDIIGKYQIFGHNMDHQIYPASLSKVFIGAAVVNGIVNGEINPHHKIEVATENVVDTDLRVFLGDTRPLLEASESVTVAYLLDLMLSRSDNTASNVLIDFLGRDRINERIITRNGWQGSEVTRKYMPAHLEPQEFRNAKLMLGQARHFAEFFFRVATGSFATAEIFRKCTGEYNENKKGLWLPGYYTSYYRKGGRHDSKLRDGRIGHYLHDAGIVVGVKSCYVVVLMTLDKNNGPESTFPMQKFAQKLFDYMESYPY